MVTCLMTNVTFLYRVRPICARVHKCGFHHRFRHKSEYLYPSRNAYLVRKSLRKVLPSFSLITCPQLSLYRPFLLRRLFSLLVHYFRRRSVLPDKIIVFMEHMADKNIHRVIGRHFTTSGQYGSNGGCHVWEDNFAS